jgi:PAS domain S-box-containing protein
MFPQVQFLEKINITQRQAALAILFFYSFAAVLTVVIQFINPSPDSAIYFLGGTCGIILFGGACFVYYKYNLDSARYFAAIAATLLVAFFLPEPFVSQYAPMAVVIPIVFALILTESLGVLVNAVLTIGILLVRAHGTGVYANPETLIIYSMIVSGLLARRLIAETSLRQVAEAQETTTQNGRRFRALMESSSDQVSVLDANGRLIYETPLSNPILGYRFEQHLGQSIFELIHPNDQGRVREIFARLLQNPDYYPCDRFRVLHNDGNWRWLEVLGKNLLAEPSIAGVVINYHDVTERVQAEEQVQKKIKHLKGLRLIDIAINSSLDLNVTLDVVLQQAISLLDVDAAAVLLVDPDTLMVEYAASRGFQAPLCHCSDQAFGKGYARQAIIERETIHIINLMETGSELANDLQVVHEPFADYHATPLIAKGEVKGVLEVYRRSLKDADDKSIDLLQILAGQAAIAIDNAQLFDSLHKANQDLERRVLERTVELNNSNAELEHANRAKDEFLANMSHELRTPLNSILGLSESLLEQRRDTLTEYQEKSLKMIESSGQHLLALINDILDLSKIEAKMFDFYPQPILIDDFCRSCLAFVKSQATKKSITLTYIPDPFISKIFADPRRLKQILVNLLTNAVKFTPEDGRVILRVNADTEEDVIQFSVIDNGIGIAHEDLKRLFQPFVQLDSSLTRQYEGTGLGLSLVQKLTDLHGGSINVKSKLGQGSEFTVNIPHRQHEVSDLESFRPEIRPLISELVHKKENFLNTPAKGGTVLLAEDNVTNVLTISEYLKNHGYTVVVAHDGQEALDKAGIINPDIILMDIQMPVMNGLDAIARLRGNIRFSTTPIIALTALTMPGDRERCLLAGASAYLSKPVRLENLRQIIENFLLPQLTVSKIAR